MDKNKNVEELIGWASSLLSSGEIVLKSNVLIQTPWSVVIKIESGEDCFYLKQTPPDLYIETEIINVIQKNVADAYTPNIMFKNEKLNCFIMKSCGDHSLRRKFNGVINEDLFLAGLNAYTNIQRSLEKNSDDFLEIGVPDWRIKHLTQLFVELLEKRELLIDEGLTSNEIDQLNKLVPTIESICQIILEKNIPETLVNCDFNENNMIINERTKRITIVDWGESVISHPFFSIASHLYAIARRYNLELNGPLLETIKQKWLSCWFDVANKNELDEIYRCVLKVHPIFSALGIHRLQMATNNTSKEMQRWFIAGSLQTLLKNERGR